MNTRRLASLLIALLPAWAGCRSSPPAITLGALLPLTGAQANYGEYGHNAIALAVSEINAAGGVRGAPLRVVYEDSKSAGEQASPAYLKLVAIDHVRATLASGDPIVPICAPIAMREKSVLVNCGADASTIRDFESFVFSAVADGNQQAEAMAAFAINRLHVRDAATLGLESEFHSTAFKEPDLEQLKVFVREFTRLGGRIVTEPRIPRGQDDFRAQLEALKAQRPSAIYYVGPTRESLLLLRQAAAVGLHTSWLSDASFETRELLAMPEAEGVTYTFPSLPPATSERAQQFASAYKQRFGIDPEVYAATFYDGVYAIKAAMDAAGGTSSEDIARGLRMTNFAGVAGPLDFTRAPWVTKPLEFRTVKGRRFETLPK